MLEQVWESFRDYDEDLEELRLKQFNLEDEIEYAEKFDDQEYLAELKPEYEKVLQEIAEMESKRNKEYQDEIKQLPQPTEKTSFEYFDITRTSPPMHMDYLPDNKDREYMLKKYFYQDAYIAEMTPQQYLELCGKYSWIDTPTDIDEIYKKMPEKHLVDEYVERFKAGEKAPMPVLNVADRGQEGRHRAFAAMKLGITEMPVLIII